jgi:two-component SAPR family response regulator
MNSNNIRVMLIEDEALNVRKIKAMLKNIGHDLVDVADNAADGLTMFEQEKPDLLLVDIVIKGKKDGVQFARELTKIQAVPVIFITSLKDYESFSRAKETEPYGFINKPFDENTLLTAIELAIQQFARNQEQEVAEPTPTDSRQLFSQNRKQACKNPYLKHTLD